MDPLVTLIGALMLVISIMLSPLSSRLGMPVLLIFLVVGMIMGEDGPGGILFDDFELAFLIANLALGVILLDGGMRTRAETFRVGLRPALVLASVGVFLTASGAGLVAWWVFDMHWLTAPPMPNCFTSISSAIQPSDVPPASIMVTSIRVRKIAIGSLLPDSISRVALTRSFK